MKVHVLGALAGLAVAGSAAAQFGGINSLAEANYWYADYFGRSNLTVTNNGLTGIRYEDRNFTGSGFANRHHAALATNNVPFQFSRQQSFQFDVDVLITGNAPTEAGIWMGTSPFFPNSANANIGQFVLLPNNGGGEIAAFGGTMPFFSNNQSPTFDNGVPSAGMARAARNQTFHLTMKYEWGATPSIEYIVNGFSTGQLRGFMNSFAGIDSGSLMGVYVQGPNGNPAAGDVDVTFSNLSIIPAPSAMALLGLGGLVGLRRRR